jgi:hypothetical protein
MVSESMTFVFDNCPWDCCNLKFSENRDNRVVLNASDFNNPNPEEKVSPMEQADTLISESCVTDSYQPGHQPGASWQSGCSGHR